MAPRKRKQTSNKQGEQVVDNRLVKALSHPVRARALAILNSRVASPKEIAQELGLEVGNVSYHVTQLEEFGCIEMVSKAQRRGATEHYYRGVTRSFLNNENWAKLSPDAKNGVSIAGLKTQNDASLKALEAGTFDSRSDRHLSCSPLNLDEMGWTEITDLLAGTLERVQEIQGRSSARQVEGGGEPIRVTVSILGFESPAGETDADRS